MPDGPLSLDALRAEVASGAIDTVVLAIVDVQGRLAGKRFDADYFVNEVVEHGTEGCNYLLAVD
ncbi:MAG TPA: glutamine synthetase, partial [Frankiaceae bacterium]|nr:glutamine synthetase [Frankiaceae bacterium]